MSLCLFMLLFLLDRQHPKCDEKKTRQQVILQIHRPDVYLVFIQLLLVFHSFFILALFQNFPQNSFLFSNYVSHLLFFSLVFSSSFFLFDSSFQLKNSKKNDAHFSQWKQRIKTTTKTTNYRKINLWKEYC